MSVRRYEETARDAARAGGAVVRAAFRDPSGLRVERKAAADYVTEIDRRSERAVVAVLQERHPSHRIVAEEGSPELAGSGERWIVDPLDGTTNFIHGLPIFGVSVGLVDEEGLAAAAVYDPIRDELFHASRGGGAFRDGERLRVSTRPSLDDALLATGFPFRDLSGVRAYLRCFESFMAATAGIRRPGAASIDLAYTAAGIYDGFWEFGLSPWDVAAGALLILEAGGVVTGADGDPSSFLTSGDVVAAGPGIHATMLETVRQALSDDPPAPRGQ